MVHSALLPSLCLSLCCFYIILFINFFSESYCVGTGLPMGSSSMRCSIPRALILKSGQTKKKKKINKEARRNSGAHECWTRWEEWALLHTVGRTACACRHFGKPPGLLLGRRVERESLLPRPAPVVQACPRESSGLAHKSTQPTLAGSLGGLREGIKSFPAF